MKTKTLYICSVCGTEYGDERFARACEAYLMLGDPPVSVGDKVHVYERYDEPRPDEVVSCKVGPSYFARMMHGSDCANYDFDVWRRFPLHEWQIEVENEHQMSKDEDSYTRFVGPSAVYIDGKKLPDQDDLRRKAESLSESER